MKTVRHEIWAPAKYISKTLHISCSGWHTQIFDVDGALVAQSRLVDSRLPSVGDSRAIAALCDPQPVDGEFGGLGNLVEYLRRRGFRLDGDGFGEALDWAP
jgi:hypothetical protein